MSRRLLNLLTALSLLLCVATVVLLVRSHCARDNLWHCGSGRLWWAEAAHGQLTVRTVGGWPAGGGWRWTAAPPDSDPIRLTLDEDRPFMLLTRAPRASWLRYRRETGWTTATARRPPEGMMTLDTPHSPPLTVQELVTPLWVPAVAAALPTATWAAARRVRAVRRRRAAGHNRCVGCGYDLRATPGRCPECGWEASVTSMQ